MPTDAGAKMNPVDEFFSAFSDVIKDIVAAAEKAAEDSDAKAVVLTFGASLTAQVRELASYVQDRTKSASRSQIEEANRAVRISDGIALAKNGKGLLGSITSFIGSMGISKLIQEIKKIVEAIFDAFGWTIPKWLRAILLLIDEIVNAILGAGSSKLASALSRQEQDYLAEMTALNRLKAVSVSSSDNDDEADD